MPNNLTFSTRSKSLILCAATVTLAGLAAVFWPIHNKISGETDIVTVAFSCDGRKILGGTRAGEIFRWDLGTGGTPGSGYAWKSAATNDSVTFNGLAFAPNGKFAVDAGDSLSIISIGSDQLPQRIGKPDLAYGAASVSSDSSRISAASSDEKLWVWRMDEVKEPRDVGPADAGVYGATTFSPDGQRLASAGHILRLVDVASGRELWERPRDSFALLAVAFSPDGKVIATGSQDTSVRLWNAGDGKEITILRGHRDYVDSVAFSPDGKKIASWARDGQLILWDLSVGAPTHKLLGKTAGGTAFSSDGRWIASGAPKNTVKFWSAISGEPADGVFAER
jgi:WD40 repeat protein